MRKLFRVSQSRTAVRERERERERVSLYKQRKEEAYL